MSWASRGARSDNPSIAHFIVHCNINVAVHNTMQISQVHGTSQIVDACDKWKAVNLIPGLQSAVTLSASLVHEDASSQTVCFSG